MTTDSWWVEPDEKLLWSGRPAPRRYVYRQQLQWQMITVVPIIGIFAIAYVYWNDASQAPVFEVVLCVLGAFLLFKLSRTVWLSRHTHYAVTERRVLMLDGHESLSVWMRDLRSFRVREERDGSGDIIFKEGSTGDEGEWIRAQGFFAIDDVNAVAGLIRTTMGSFSVELSTGGRNDR